MISYLYLGHDLNSQLQRLLHRSDRIRNPRILHNQLHTLVDQALRMPAA